MFKLFHHKSEKEILQSKYDHLMEEVFNLEQRNVEKAENKRREAQVVLMKLIELEKHQLN